MDSEVKLFLIVNSFGNSDVLVVYKWLYFECFGGSVKSFILITKAGKMIQTFLE